MPKVEWEVRRNTQVPPERRSNTRWANMPFDEMAVGEQLYIKRPLGANDEYYNQMISSLRSSISKKFNANPKSAKEFTTRKLDGGDAIGVWRIK